jgi:hypothetical protein
MIKAKQQRRTDKRRITQGNGPTLPTAEVTAVNFVDGTHAKVTFDSPVQIASNRMPTTWLFGTGNFSPLSISAFDATSYTFLVDGTIVAAQDYSIGANDPAARTPGGGYVGASAGTIDA